jgi:hypothetical protein
LDGSPPVLASVGRSSPAIGSRGLACLGLGQKVSISMDPDGCFFLSPTDHRTHPATHALARSPCRRRPRKTTRQSRGPAPCDPSSLAQQRAPWKSVSPSGGGGQGRGKEKKKKKEGKGKYSPGPPLTQPRRSNHIPRRVYVPGRPPAPQQRLLTGRSNPRDSRQDPDTAQPQAGRGAEAAVAAIRPPVVCRVHDADHWQLGQGGHP